MGEDVGANKKNFKGERNNKKIKTPMWKSRDQMYDKKKNEWMRKRKKERKKEKKEKYEKEKKIWVCIKWTPRFSKVH
jgi:Fe-S oxidoreductase